MLVAAQTLTDHFEQEREIFVAENPLLADSFISIFRGKIQQIFTTTYVSILKFRCELHYANLLSV